MILERYVRDFLAGYEEQLFHGKWNYTGGCVLTGAKYMYEATGDPFYLQVIDDFARRYVDENGTIFGFDPEEHNVDLMCSGRVLYGLLDRTGEARFRNGIEIIMENMRNQPRTKENNFWHKLIYPNQVWLDGLYMAQPFYVEYESRFGTREGFKDTLSQFKNVRKYLFDENKKLYYHGYDESRSVYWADPVTGLSKSFWLRSIGWLLMAFVDCYELMDCSKADKQLLADLLKEAVDGLLAHQDKESCLFYQVVDMPELPGNYLETSGSAMAAYALLKGFRLGMLQKEAYKKHGEDILCGLCARHMRMDGGRLHLTQICRTGGLGPASDLRRDGTPEYYVSEPIMEDNGHGVAALIMAYSEYLRLRA